LPDLGQKRAIIAVYVLSWVGIAAVLGAIVSAPLLRSSHPRASSFLYVIFAPFCHQIPSRCFRLAGFPLAVCARCLGLYVGFAAGLIVYFFRRGFREVRLPSLRVFLIVSIPSALDVAGSVLRLWDSSPWLRFGLAAAWGILLPFFFITGLVEAWVQLGDRRRRPAVAGGVRGD
jgi:uncharacterized membrane protein